MEIKLGYKLTEVGGVPEDWKVTTLGSVCSTSSGTTPARRMSERYYQHGTTPWVKTLDLNNSEIFATDECVTAKAIQETSLRVYPVGTVLVAMYGGFNQIGRTGLLRVWAATNQAITAIQPKDSELLSSEYLLAVLNFKVDYWKSVASSSRKDPNITGQDVRALPVSLPARLEQEAIAEALSDADALIESLERLIAKKRQIKQGAMQELLTGKRRLPGFSEAWVKSRLDEFGEWKGGMTPSMRNERFWQGGTIPWISSGDVKSPRLESTGFSITRDAVKAGVTTLVPEYTIVIVTRSGILRKHLPVAMTMTAMAINQDIKALIPRDGVEASFLLHALILNGDRIRGRCLKSGTTVESIEFSWLKSFTIPMPPRNEQIAISGVLNEMDSEIHSLEAKLVKARQVKQGMMQELLTGRIRLI